MSYALSGFTTQSYRTYDTTVRYNINDLVLNGTNMFRALSSVPPGYTPQVIPSSLVASAPGSTQASAYQLNGNASNTGPSEVRLTTATNSISGSSVMKTPIDLSVVAVGGVITVAYQTEASGGTGADGYTFSMLDSTRNAITGIYFGGTGSGGVGSGGFALNSETYSGYPGSNISWRNSGAATPATSTFAITDSTAGLRGIINWTLTCTKTAALTYSVAVTKGGSAYGTTTYTNVYIPDSMILAFSAATGGSNDNQYFRNVSVSTPIQYWTPVQSTVFLPVVTQTTNYTLTVSDGVVFANGTSLTMTLPAANTAPGRSFHIKNINASSATVAATSGNIDGVASQTLAQYAMATYISDGSNWWAI